MSDCVSVRLSDSHASFFDAASSILAKANNISYVNCKDDLRQLKQFVPTKCSNTDTLISCTERLFTLIESSTPRDSKTVLKITRTLYQFAITSLGGSNPFLRTHFQAMINTFEPLECKILQSVITEFYASLDTVVKNQKFDQIQSLQELVIKPTNPQLIKSRNLITQFCANGIKRLNSLKKLVNSLSSYDFTQTNDSYQLVYNYASILDCIKQQANKFDLARKANIESYPILETITTFSSLLYEIESTLVFNFQFFIEAYRPLREKKCDLNSVLTNLTHLMVPFEHNSIRDVHFLLGCKDLSQKLISDLVNHNILGDVSQKYEALNEFLIDAAETYFDMEYHQQPFLDTQAKYERNLAVESIRILKEFSHDIKLLFTPQMIEHRKNLRIFISDARRLKNLLTSQSISIPEILYANECYKNLSTQLNIIKETQSTFHYAHRFEYPISTEIKEILISLDKMDPSHGTLTITCIFADLLNDLAYSTIIEKFLPLKITRKLLRPISVLNGNIQLRKDRVPEKTRVFKDDLPERLMSHKEIHKAKMSLNKQTLQQLTQKINTHVLSWDDIEKMRWDAIRTILDQREPIFTTSYIPNQLEKDLYLLCTTDIELNKIVKAYPKNFRGILIDSISDAIDEYSELVRPKIISVDQLTTALSKLNLTHPDITFATIPNFSNRLPTRIKELIQSKRVSKQLITRDAFMNSFQVFRSSVTTLQLNPTNYIEKTPEYPRLRKRLIASIDLSTLELTDYMSSVAAVPTNEQLIWLNETEEQITFEWYPLKDEQAILAAIDRITTNYFTL